MPDGMHSANPQALGNYTVSGSEFLKKDVAGLLKNITVASEQHGRIDKLTDDPSRKDQGELSEHFG